MAPNGQQWHLRESVASLPVGATTRADGLVETVTLAVTAVLLGGRGKTTGLTALVDGVDDPVDAGVAADGLVRGIDEDDLEVLVGRVLVDPVRVKDAQVSALAANTLLSGGLEGTLVLELVDSVSTGLAEGGTLGNRLLATTTADADTVDDVSLLGLVSQTTGLIGARRAGSAVDDVQLAVLPAANTQQEAHDIRLLLLGQLLEILVGSHIVYE